MACFQYFVFNFISLLSYFPASAILIIIASDVQVKRTAHLQSSEWCPTRRIQPHVVTTRFFPFDLSQFTNQIRPSLTHSFLIHFHFPQLLSNIKEVKVQEQIQKLQVGTIPRSVWVLLSDDLVDICKVEFLSLTLLMACHFLTVFLLIHLCERAHFSLFVCGLFSLETISPFVVLCCGAGCP